MQTTLVTAEWLKIQSAEEVMILMLLIFCLQWDVTGAQNIIRPIFQARYFLILTG